MKRQRTGYESTTNTPTNKMRTTQNTLLRSIKQVKSKRNSEMRQNTNGTRGRETYRDEDGEKDVNEGKTARKSYSI